MTNHSEPAVTVSFCMVSLNCWQVIEPCLESIAEHCSDLSHEIIIVDNASTDGTPEKLLAGFSNVRLIRNTRNVGFSRGTNQGIEVARGEFICWLNTDTILYEDTLPPLLEFLASNPKAGIVGPKMLNADGSFQPQCRRGMPTPQAAAAYMLGLHRVWPDHPITGQYLMTHMPVDEAVQVAGVSGACLLTRRAVIADIGPIDDAYFGFGEDLDWCVRAAEAGWEVWYEPASRITHLKGQGGAHSKPYHKVFGIHQAMWLFYARHMRSRSAIPMTAAVAVGIGLSLANSLASTWLRQRLRQVKRWSSARGRPAEVT